VCLKAKILDSSRRREWLQGLEHTTMDRKITGTKEPIIFFSLIFDSVINFLLVIFMEYQFI